MQRNEVIGQMARRMEPSHEMVQENRLPHALMFCRSAGCGKTGEALAFASYLLGDSPMLEMGTSDLHFTFPTIKTATWAATKPRKSPDFKERMAAAFQEGPYVQISDWMLKMGKTDADLTSRLSSLPKKPMPSSRTDDDVESGRI